MLVEMFVGAARRLVANLTVEQCLTRRKEGLAAELMREIAPVVSGSGPARRRTHKGWGVVIDTIEIQDVRVLQQQVFANMQARFRQEQERLAREAELAKDRAVKQDEAAAERQIELVPRRRGGEIRRAEAQRRRAGAARAPRRRGAGRRGAARPGARRSARRSGRTRASSRWPSWRRSSR